MGMSVKHITVCVDCCAVSSRRSVWFGRTKIDLSLKIIA